MRIGEAARLLGVSVAAVRARCDRSNPSIRGLPPRSGHNPGREWLVSAEDVEAALRPDFRHGLAPEPGLSLGDTGVQLEMLQGALSEAQVAQLAEKDERIALLERMLADRDASIVELERRLDRVLLSFVKEAPAPS